MKNHPRRSKPAAVLFLIFCFLLMPLTAANSAQNPHQLFQSIINNLDYVSVDYPAIIKDGKIVDESEYSEQIEISRHALSQMQTLPDNQAKPALITLAEKLNHAIQNKAAASEIVMLSRDAVAMLTESYNVSNAPSVLPLLSDGKKLYQENCEECHGLSGLGNGVRAASLTPAPADFTDQSRQQYRNIYALFNVISLGAANTAMPSFSHLTTEQRWALAFYISNFYASASDISQGEQLWSQQAFTNALGDIHKLTQAKPVDIQAALGKDGLAALAYLRSNPQVLEQHMPTPLDISRSHLNASLSAYKQANPNSAYEQSLIAYVDGFERIEAKLKVIAPELRSDIEHKMTQYRNSIKNNVSVSQLEDDQQVLLGLLDQAEQQLGQPEASASVAFISSMVILLREGLEAILVLAAIIAVLIKSGHQKALRYIHAGWIGALITGFITWYIAAHFIAISGASRELTEGITALIAAGMLLYVGFWLHNQTNAVQWKTFIHAKITTSLSNGTLWGLAFIAFIAVYREVFESILFYQSLIINSQPVQHSYIIAGIAAAIILLALLALLIMRYSVRLPLRSFFRVNMLLMFLLALVFAGKGITALQEAGSLPSNSINFIQIDILGIYPNLESLGTQLSIICLAIIWGIYGRIKDSRNRIVSS